MIEAENTPVVGRPLLLSREVTTGVSAKQCDQRAKKWRLETLEAPVKTLGVLAMIPVEPREEAELLLEELESGHGPLPEARLHGCAVGGQLEACRDE